MPKTLANTLPIVYIHVVGSTCISRYKVNSSIPLTRRVILEHEVYPQEDKDEEH